MDSVELSRIKLDDLDLGMILSHISLPPVEYMRQVKCHCGFQHSFGGVQLDSSKDNA